MNLAHPKLLAACILLTVFSPITETNAEDENSESEFLDRLTSSYENAVNLKTAELKTEASPLKTRYLQALEKIQTSYQSSGDIDGAVQIKAERERVSTMDGVGDPVGEPSKLEKLEQSRSIFERVAVPIRRQFEEDFASLREKRNAALERYIAEVTKAGDLTKAVTLKQKLDEWQAEEKYSPEKIPENAEEVIAYLTDTTWTYVGDTGRDQYMRFYPEQYVMTMWQEELSRTFGMIDYRVTPDLDVIWAYAGEEIRMEFDDEFRSYKCFMHKTNTEHRVGKFFHRGSELLPE